MEYPFDVGDLVSLKSGGPVMTVANWLSAESVELMWFDKDDHLQHHSFFPACLSVEFSPRLGIGMHLSMGRRTPTIGYPANPVGRKPNSP